MTDIYNRSDIAYLSSLGSPSFETDDEEVVAQLQTRPEWPVPNHGTYTHVYIPQRSPQLQSVEELQHRRRMQSVSAQTLHIVPADFVEASYASSPSASPSSLTVASSSCQMEEIQRVFDSVWEKQIWQEVPWCADTQAPARIPSYVTEFPVNNNDFEQCSSPPSSSGSSPSYSPPSSSSPSSAGYSSSSPSGSHVAFTPPPQSAPYMSPHPSSGSFQTMDPSQTFIHPDRMGGPSTSTYNSAYDHSPPLHTMNMGYNYSPIPPTSGAPGQYPTDETGYYPQDLNTDPSNFDHLRPQYQPQPRCSPPPVAIQDRSAFHRYDSVEPPQTKQYHPRPLRTRPSDPQSSAYYQQSPSSSFTPSRDTQLNYASGYGLPPQQHIPVHQHIPPQQHISAQPPRQNTSLRQRSPCTNTRHQPYQKPLAEDRARYNTNTNAAAQPRPSRKGKRSPTRPQKPIGSSLHYGETKPRYNHRFGPSNGISPYTSSEEDFVEQELPRPVKPSQSGPTQTTIQDISFTGNQNQTFKFVPMNMDANTGTMRKSKVNSTTTVDVDLTDDSENTVDIPPTEAPNAVKKRLFKPKTGTVMSSKREGEFVLTDIFAARPKFESGYRIIMDWWFGD